MVVCCPNYSARSRTIRSQDDPTRTAARSHYSPTVNNTVPNLSFGWSLYHVSGKRTLYSVITYCTAGVAFEGDTVNIS